jgi:hypothetical protein
MSPPFLHIGILRNIALSKHFTENFFKMRYISNEEENEGTYTHLINDIL